LIFNAESVLRALLREAGCSSRNIYLEKMNGARANGRELNPMLGGLTPGTW
jgi:hypothetical protein